MKPLQILEDRGFKYLTDQNYATDSGVEYYVGFQDDIAGVVALIHDENIYFIVKDELREISETVKIAGVNKVYLYTNYGIELHSEYETPATVGMNKIKKVNAETGANY